MKQWLKNLAIAGATAGAVVLGAASASAVSFTVVIEKIELMPNGNSTDRFVIYNPAAGIGASATSTLDLLNANKTGATLSVAAPKAGTYNTMLVTFSNISVQAETATVSATQSLLASLGGAQGFGTELGRDVLVMGDAGTGGASIGTLLGGGITPVTMQPIVSNGATVSLPAFDFFLPAANVVTTGTGTVNVTKVPVAISVARTDVDSAAVPNVTIGVKPTAFKQVTTAQGGTTGATFAFKTGLFRSALDLKPIYVATSTATSSTAVTAGSVTEVTFLDVADGTYLPLAWVDTDNDGLLDTDEPTIMATTATTIDPTNANLTGGTDKERFLTINKSDIFGANATTTGVISTTSAAFNTSATTTGGSTTNVNTGAPLGTTGNNPTGMLGHSGTFKLFPAREISLTVLTSEDGSVTIADNVEDCVANNTCGLIGTWNGGAQVAANVTLAVTMTVGNVTTPSITFAVDKNGAGGANLADTNTVSYVVVDNAGSITNIAGNSLISYSQLSATSSQLKLSPVPLATIVNLDDTVNAGYGTYSVATATGMRVSGTPTGNNGVGSITQAAAVLDSDAAANYNRATRTARIIQTNRVNIDTSVGN